MIKEARREDKNEIYELWKQAYPDSEQKKLNFYFRNIYDDGLTLVQEVDHHIVASLQMNTQVVSFHGYLLDVSYLLGMSTLADYRSRGLMKELFLQALDECSHNHLLTMVKALQPKIYEHYGFSTVYERKQYGIHREYLDAILDSDYVIKDVTSQELLEAYETFTIVFDGYRQRTLAYYDRLLKELELGMKHIVAYKKEKESVSGYLIYETQGNDIIIKEAIYLDSISLKRMMKSILDDYSMIRMEVSSSEQIEKIFPLAKPINKAYMMARINNYELFNKLFNTDVKTVDEAFAILKKPLWYYESY